MYIMLMSFKGIWAVPKWGRTYNNNTLGNCS